MINSKTLYDLLDVASDALAAEGEDVPPVFQQFCFTKRSVLAYNDIIGVRLVNPGTGFEGTAPGHLLLRFLKSCNGADVRFGQWRDQWRLQSGRSKLDFSHGKPEDFPFKFPPSDSGVHITVDDELFRLLGLCSSIVGSRGGILAWTSGVVCRFVDGELTLASVSPTREVVHLCKLEFDSSDFDLERIVLSSSFCRTMIAMKKAFPEEGVVLKLSDRYVLAQFGDWNAVYGKLVIPDDKVDIVKRADEIIAEASNFVEISPEFPRALDRATSIAGKDVRSTLSIKDGKKLYLRTKIPGGVVQDIVFLEQELSDIRVDIEPAKVGFKIESCSEISVNEGMIVMRSEEGDFTRIVANKT